MLINPKGKLLAVLDHAEAYRSLAIRSRDRRERENASSNYTSGSPRSFRS
jgi:hypothetical protein